MAINLTNPELTEMLPRIVVFGVGGAGAVVGVGVGGTGSGTGSGGGAGNGGSGGGVQSVAASVASMSYGDRIKLKKRCHSIVQYPGRHDSTTVELCRIALSMR